MRLYEKYGWTRQEPGWYTRFVKPNRWQGICQESDGYWYIYGGRNLSDDCARFKTLKAALQRLQDEEELYEKAPSIFD